MPKVLIDDTFGIMEYINHKSDEYLGNHYSFTKEVPELNMTFNVRVECEEKGPSNKQKALFKIVTENFNQLEKKMYERMITKTHIKADFKDFKSCFSYPSMIIYNSQGIEAKWFLLIDPSNINIMHLGFRFKDFEVTEVLGYDNKGSEITES